MKKFIGGYQPEPKVDRTSPPTPPKGSDELDAFTYAADRIGQAAKKATCSMEEMKKAMDETKVEEYEPTQHYQYMKNMISGLVGLELRDANQHYPLFASNHEAHGVILEELQETNEELEFAAGRLKCAWHSTRQNSTCETYFKSMKEYSMNAAYEAIQLAAMCQKAIDSERERKK